MSAILAPPATRLRVKRFTSLEALAPWAEEWDRLAAGNPFRSWTWMSTWWRHYRPTNAAENDPYSPEGLYVLAVFDAHDRLRALAPWHRRRMLGQGRALEWLGSGEVCAEYLGLLADSQMAELAAVAVASWLCRAARVPQDRWHLLVLTSVAADDAPTGLLVKALAGRGCNVHRRPGFPCWRIELPADWESYLDQLSKSRRKEARKLVQKMLDAGLAVAHVVRQPSQHAAAFELLVKLHQRRRQALGEPGCFASPRFAAFHREVSQALCERGQCEIHWLEIDGQPAAAEYVLVGKAESFVYQAGMEPTMLGFRPGKLLMWALIRQAIAQGLRGVDFLRGAEPYKAQLGASPQQIAEYRIAAPRCTARWLLRLWAIVQAAKRTLGPVARQCCGAVRRHRRALAHPGDASSESSETS
jgi:CelD/BcsL family acetyltransferase involved in cellulose biosynthesis